MKIYVQKQNKVLGFLEETTLDTIRFTYLDELSPENYLEGIEDKTNISDGLFLIFQNMFPENGQIEAIKSKHAVGTTIELLLYLEDVHGSYVFLTQEAYNSHNETNHTKYI